jgi:hypothetical protein
MAALPRGAGPLILAASRQRPLICQPSDSEASAVTYDCDRAPSGALAQV